MRLLLNSQLVIAGFVLLYSVAVNARQADWAAPLTDAQALLQAENYQQAYQAYAQHAEQGNGIAQFTLALFHQLGWGIDENPSKACYWFKQASDSGIPAAMEYQADCMLHGDVTVDTVKSAFELYLQAFDAGMYRAGCKAGKMLVDGTHPSHDIDAGVRLCRQAADAGSIDAALLLASWYRTGEHVEKNTDLAIRLYSLAAPEKQPEAAFQLGRFFDEGKAIDGDARQAAYWYEVAASQGETRAYLPVAALYWQLTEDSQQHNAKFLAKAYLWANTAHKAQPSKDASILFQTVTNATPTAWKADLNRQVEEHLQVASRARK